jgi:TIR domain
MIEVIPYRKRLEKTEFYRNLYLTATRVQILGISCTAFFKDLYPACYEENVGVRDDSRKAATARIARMTPTLKDCLIRGTEIEVYFLDPECQYVATRMMEVGKKEKGCRHDIIQSLGATRSLRRDLMRAKQGCRIEGSLQVSLIKSNPYYSISTFDTTPAVAVMGFIAGEGLANELPALKITNDDAEAAKLTDKCKEHLARIKTGAHKVFHWGKNGPGEFNECNDDIDLFWSYHHEDLDTVRQIDTQLMWKGVRSWLDVSISGGDVWLETLIKAAERARSAVICFGPKGQGSWQAQREIPILLHFLRGKGLKIIPIVLKGVERTPEFPDPLRDIQLIDFRKSDPDPMKALLDAVASARR